jgi:hypothetical protein
MRTSTIAKKIWDNGRQLVVAKVTPVKNIRGTGMNAVGEAEINGRLVACYRKHGSRTEWVTYMAAPVKF